VFESPDGGDHRAAPRRSQSLSLKISGQRSRQLVRLVERKPPSDDTPTGHEGELANDAPIVLCHSVDHARGSFVTLTSAMLNFARIWQAADKIVYSKSLEIVSTPNLHRRRVSSGNSTRRWRIAA
jgi:hypothetical protein